MNCFNQRVSGWSTDEDEKKLLRYQYFSTNTEWSLHAFKVDGMLLEDKFAKVEVLTCLLFEFRLH